MRMNVLCRITKMQLNKCRKNKSHFLFYKGIKNMHILYCHIYYKYIISMFVPNHIHKYEPKSECACEL